MSWLTDETEGRICDGYPAGTTYIEGFDAKSIAAEAWRTIPYGPDLSNFIKVSPGPRVGAGRRTWRVLYEEAIRKAVNPNRPWSFMINLYGFLGDMHVGKTGNWDLGASTASKALQFATLLPGPYPAPFDAQATALCDIQCFIAGSIRGAGLSAEERDVMLDKYRQSLFLARKVFTKVNDRTPPAIHSSGNLAKMINANKSY